MAQLIELRESPHQLDEVLFLPPVRRPSPPFGFKICAFCRHRIGSDGKKAADRHCIRGARERQAAPGINSRDRGALEMTEAPLNRLPGAF
jgi:hypothetical protein